MIDYSRGSCFICVLYFPTYRLLVNTQIFSYAFRRCNKRILSPSRFLHSSLSCFRSRREGGSIQSI
uniref:Uncharacterized protein n=1 Tax=Siphoviridae sp. ctio73 TaxID=2826435 RepID=A0A8S5MX40_9CAUD|nr:MAG TPA: hypothetical protein [Siphoviridae sp. ctio73]